MPYVERDESNQIRALYSEMGRPDGVTEWLEEDDSEVQDYLNPQEPVTYTAEELFDIFEPEYDAIYEASKTDKQVAFFFDKLRTRNRPIRADNPKLKQGLDLYVAMGLITQEKADAITGA